MYLQRIKICYHQKIKKKKNKTLKAIQKEKSNNIGNTGKLVGNRIILVCIKCGANNTEL